ncbi:MAG TPA: energy-coupling factor transporter ATPase [Clostridiales bacterium]|nr:energy-coupling factor transporter ATPase [Clostridiales bacterium]
MPANVHLALDRVTYQYDQGGKTAVKDVTLSIGRGEFVALLGHNGSGKSTIAKLLNGLYTPTKGTVQVSGMDTSDSKLMWEIRRRAGMVFQNPDNQIVATRVRDDVAFGLENIGVPSDEMPGRIDQALSDVGMTAFADRAPHLLSGGQKQRVAIAGILAMQPEALILDEATAMLDPSGRKDVLDTVKRLNSEQGITVVWITHFMEEATQADRVVVMHEGTIVMDGTPRQVFAQTKTIRAYRLDVPPMTSLAENLRERGIPFSEDVLSVNDMMTEVLRLAHRA